MSLVYRLKSGQWRAVKRIEYVNESQLQQMLYESPDLIPMRGAREPGHAFIREADLPGSGNTDLLGVDTSGNIYVVECKLATNREVRRQVIGQVLEYAAYLWEMSYDDFDSLFIARAQRSLEELISTKAEGGWGFESFRTRVIENLSAGSFDLFIAVDEINEELRQIIVYLQRQLSGARVKAIELRLHGDAEIEILAPRVFGESLEKEPTAREKKQTIEQVFARCATDTERARLKLFVEEWTGLGNLVEPGTSGISFRAQIGDRVQPIFWAPTPTFVNARFSGLIAQGIPSEAVERYRKQIADLTGFDRTKVLAQSSPRAPLANLSEDDVRAIVRANQELVDTWRKSLSG